MIAHSSGCTTSDLTERGLVGELVEQRPVDELRQRRVTLTQPRGEHRLQHREFQSHVDPLRALAGEHHQHPARRAGTPTRSAADPPTRRGVRRGRRRPPRRGAQTPSGRAGRNRGRRRTAPGAPARARAAGKPGPAPLPECGRTAPPGSRRPVLRRARRLRLRRLLQDDVRVGAADPERRDPRAARRVGLPRPGLLQQLDTAAGPLDLATTASTTCSVFGSTPPAAPAPS